MLTDLLTLTEIDDAVTCYGRKILQLLKRIAELMGTGVEMLAVGKCLLRKEAQDPSLKIDYKEAFELD